MTLDQINSASGGDGRNALRSFIAGHSDWSRMRTDNGLDLGNLSMSGLRDVSRALATGGTIVAATLHNGANGKDVVVERPIIPSIELPSSVFRPQPDSDAEALARIIRGIAEGAAPKPQTIDREAVEAIAREILAEAVNVVRVEIKEGDKVHVKDMGIQHKSFSVLMKALSAHHPSGRPIPVWLGGPAGSGKTYACEAAAKAFGIEFHHQPTCLMPHDLLGFPDAGGKYHSTPFVDAYRNGGLVLLDEVDAGGNEALLALKGALANGHIWLGLGEGGELVKVKRHSQCYIVAAANTWGLGATADYIGRNKLDAAFLDEFIKISWSYDEKFERSLSGNVDWAIRVQKAREAFKAKSIKVVISPRATIHGAALIAAGFSEDEAANMTYLGSLSDDQKKIVQ